MDPFNFTAVFQVVSQHLSCILFWQSFPELCDSVDLHSDLMAYTSRPNKFPAERNELSDAIGAIGEPGRDRFWEILDAAVRRKSVRTRSAGTGYANYADLTNSLGNLQVRSI